MQDISRIKFRKKVRRIVLRRRNIVAIPEKTVKYIQKSATFAGIMSDMGIERIMAYVKSMENHAEILAEMIDTGIINEQILCNEVSSMNRESEKTGTDIALIGNSLIRFIHSDYTRIKNSRVPRSRKGKTCTPENEQETTSMPDVLPVEAPIPVLANGDSHE